MRARVEFIPDRSNPPPTRINNPEARKQNSEVREEIKAILDIIKIGQSYKVYGMDYTKVTSMSHALVKGTHIKLTVRNYEKEGFIRVWRTS